MMTSQIGELNYKFIITAKNDVINRKLRYKKTPLVENCVMNSKNTHLQLSVKVKGRLLLCCVESPVCIFQSRALIERVWIHFSIFSHYGVIITRLLGSSLWIELCSSCHVDKAKIGLTQFYVDLAQVIVDLRVCKFDLKKKIGSELSAIVTITVACSRIMASLTKFWINFRVSLLVF